jgi:hypothetical protein
MHDDGAEEHPSDVAAAIGGDAQSGGKPKHVLRRLEFLRRNGSYTLQMQDLRVAARLLWRDKAFAVRAALTLAVCIGANTSLFTVFV